MNDTLTIVMAILGMVFFGLTFLLSLAILHNLTRILEGNSVSQLRENNIYEKVYKIEGMVQSLTQNFMADSILQSMPADHVAQRAIRTPSGVIFASSLEEFLDKINHDPNFRGITKEQLDELRKLFESNNFTDNEEDESDES